MLPQASVTRPACACAVLQIDKALKTYVAPHVAIAKKYNKPLITYEAGQSLTGDNELPMKVIPARHTVTRAVAYMVQGSPEHPFVAHGVPAHSTAYTACCATHHISQMVGLAPQG